MREIINCVRFCHFMEWVLRGVVLWGAVYGVGLRKKDAFSLNFVIETERKQRNLETERKQRKHNTERENNPRESFREKVEKAQPQSRESTTPERESNHQGEKATPEREKATPES